MTGMRVQFRYRHTDASGQQQLATYDEQMTCVPRAGDTIRFADRQVVVDSVVWNMDPAMPCDVIVTLS